MPTERLAFLVLAAAIVLAILLSGPVALPAGWDKAAHFAAFSALTFCLWQANAGSAPLLVVLAAVAFAGLDEWRQAYLPERVSDAQDFLADLCAVATTAALLFMQRKSVCAESSPR
jgi:VanZ family protein